MDWKIKYKKWIESLFAGDIFLFIPPIRRQIHLFLFHIEERLNIFVGLELFIVPFIIALPEGFSRLVDHDNVVTHDQQVFVLAVDSLSQ